jgi:hypothetical protein
VGWIGRLAALALAGLLLLAACGGDGQADAEAGLRISLIPAAGGIAGESLTVELADREGNPITDATVSLEGNMNHAGMVPVFSADVRDEADGAADGRYAIPFQFTMLGDWIVTVAVQLADGTAIRQDVDVTVTGGEVRVR